MKPLLWLSVFFLSSPQARAEQIQALVRGDQSLSAYYSGIHNAQKSIDIATYLFDPCQSSSKLLIDELIQKARKGVKVRLIVEEFSTSEPNRSGFPAYLASKNIELRYAGSASFFALDGTRLHAKEFVVDGRSFLVGGRNISDEYFGLHSKLNYLDQDLWITGPAAANAQKEFNLLWTFTHSAPGGGDVKSFVNSCLAPKKRDLEVATYIRANADGILSTRPARSCKISYAVDYPDTQLCSDCHEDPTNSDYLIGERWRNKHATRLFLDFVHGTKQKIEIANQYYMPWKRVDEALASLRQQKKAVTVYSNSKGDIDFMNQNEAFTCYIQSSAARDGVGTQRVGLLSSKGAMGDAWQLTPANSEWRIHTKSALRDGRDVLVSSFNIDPRSYFTNIESVGTVSNCPDLVDDLSPQYNHFRNTIERDRTCTACRNDIVPANLVPGVNCGGNPTFY